MQRQFVEAATHNAARPDGFAFTLKRGRLQFSNGSTAVVFKFLPAGSFFHR